jgi:hypothetical protein
MVRLPLNHWSRGTRIVRYPVSVDHSGVVSHTLCSLRPTTTDLRSHGHITFVSFVFIAVSAQPCALRVTGFTWSYEEACLFVFVAKHKRVRFEPLGSRGLIERPDLPALKCSAH